MITQSTDSIAIYAYRTCKDIINKNDESKYRNISTLCKHMNMEQANTQNVKNKEIRCNDIIKQYRSS